MIPKYEEVKQNIIADINEGKFRPGDKIYSEGELKQKYGYSNTTIVKALNDLVKDGYLIRRQGEGTFVRRNFIHKSVYFSESSPLNDWNHSKQAIEKTETVLVETIVEPKIADKLGERNSEAKIVHVIQLAYVNDIVWKIQHRYALFDRLKDENSFARIKKGKSITKELVGVGEQDDLPVNILIGLKNRHELKSLLPDFGELHKFFVNNSSDSFDVQRVTFNLKKEPIEFSQSFINHRYYFVEVSSI